jgi:hypothetical protein
MVPPVLPQQTDAGPGSPADAGTAAAADVVAGSAGAITAKRKSKKGIRRVGRTCAFGRLSVQFRIKNTVKKK